MNLDLLKKDKIKVHRSALVIVRFLLWPPKLKTMGMRNRMRLIVIASGVSHVFGNLVVFRFRVASEKLVL